MRMHLRQVLVAASLPLCGTGLIVLQSESRTTAAILSSDYCTADVNPTTGVSVSVALDGDCVVKFASDTTVTWTRPTGISSFELLVVAGGGGGGGHPSGDPGGGGGGGVVHVPTVTLSAATYEVKVGVGGVGSDAAPHGVPWFGGRDGGNSIFGTAVSSPLITAHGGGGGGGAYVVSRDGGSGGGAHCGGGQTTATRGVVDSAVTGATSYGMMGGSSAGCGNGSGGGGGALTAGQDGSATKAGDGGQGVALDVLGTGVPVVYGSGGGGAAGDVTSSPGVGGTNAGNGKQGDGPVSILNLGVDGTGGGGGAQFCPSVLPCTAGKGGDGVVIIRYEPTPIAPTNTAVPSASGALTIGSTLSATNGSWGGTARTYAYQWERGSSASGTFAAITGASGSTHVVTSSDAGSYLRVVVTATNAAGTARATSGTVGPIAIPSTTTTTTATTTTTVPATTTTPPETTMVPAQIATATTQPVAQWQISRATKETKTGVRITETTSVATTTTVPLPPTTAPLVAPTSFNPPTPAELIPGQASVVVDGESSLMSISRRDDQLIVSHGNFSSTLSTIEADGTRRPLSNDGNVRFQQDDSLSISMSGFATFSDVEVWMFSEPALLGVVRTDVSGTATSLFKVPSKIESGSHRIVIAGVSPDGDRVELTVGVLSGATSSGVSTAGKVLISIPIAAAVLFALVIPARRRRKVQMA